MSPTTLYRMPRDFSAGTTVTYRRQLADYPATEGWVLSAVLAGPKTAAADVEAVDDTFVVTFSATATADLTEGSYRFEERVTKGDTVDRTDRFQVQVAGDVAAAEDGDYASWVEQALAADEASLKTGAGDVLRYQIGSRTLEHYSLEERMKLRRELRAELRSLRGGGGSLREVNVYFTGTGLKS